MNHEKDSGNLTISSHFMAGKTDAKKACCNLTRYGGWQKKSELVELAEHIWLTISPSTLYFDSFFIFILLASIWFTVLY